MGDTKPAELQPPSEQTTESMITFELGATIPTRQYENLQPKVVVIAPTFEEARDKALKQIQSVSEMVSDKPIPIRFGSPAAQAVAKLVIKTCDITGSEVFMDEAAHTYADKEGNTYLSGSTFANRFKAKFNQAVISQAMAVKHGVDKNNILQMWKTNAEASTSLGTAIHAGLELYGKFLNLSMKVKGTDESAMHKNPIIGNIVKLFYEGRENEKAKYEVFVVDKDGKLCGFIDRLLVVDAEKKIVRVQDYKTNPDIKKKETILAPFKGVVDNTSLGAYWLQLAFYGHILAKAGYTVEGYDIFNYDGTAWSTYSHDVIDISEGLN